MGNPNDPAYPSREYFCGLTKRELFAAMAMQGFAACQGVFEEWLPKQTAQQAVCIADALLSELAKPTK